MTLNLNESMDYVAIQPITCETALKTILCLTHVSTCCRCSVIAKLYSLLFDLVWNVPPLVVDVLSCAVRQPGYISSYGSTRLRNICCQMESSKELQRTFRNKAEGKSNAIDIAYSIQKRMKTRKWFDW